MISKLDLRNRHIETKVSIMVSWAFKPSFRHLTRSGLCFSEGSAAALTEIWMAHILEPLTPSIMSSMLLNIFWERNQDVHEEIVQSLISIHTFFDQPEKITKLPHLKKRVVDICFLVIMAWNISSSEIRSMVILLHDL
jgi:hypothetical protein